MSKEDKITAGILGGAMIAAILVAMATIVFSGCVCTGCKAPGPIVHPTDEQIENGTKGGETKDPPYVPWWAEGK